MSVSCGVKAHDRSKHFSYLVIGIHIFIVNRGSRHLTHLSEGLLPPYSPPGLQNLHLVYSGRILTDSQIWISHRQFLALTNKSAISQPAKHHLIQLLLSRDYLLQIILALIDFLPVPILISRSCRIPIGSFYFLRWRHPLQFRPVVSSLPRFHVIFLTARSIWPRPVLHTHGPPLENTCYGAPAVVLIMSLRRKCSRRKVPENVTFYRMARSYSSFYLIGVISINTKTSLNFTVSLT